MPVNHGSKLVEYSIEHLGLLLSYGAHFVICKSDKEPSFDVRYNKGRWRDFKPSRVDLHFHIAGSGLVGLVPMSLGWCCIDIDEGDKDAVVSYCEINEVCHRVVKTPRGWHIWVRIVRGLEIENYKWVYGDGVAKGDIRCSNGYAIVWSDGPLHDLALDLDDHPGASRGFFSAFKPVKEVDIKYDKGNRNNSLSREVFKCLLNDKSIDNAIKKARVAGLPEREIQATVASAKKKVGKLEERLYERKDKKALEDVLKRMGISWRYNLLSQMTELQIKGGKWLPMTDRLASKVKSRIAEEFSYRSSTGISPLEYSMNKYSEYLDALLYDAEVNPFLDWLESLPEWDEENEEPRISYLLSSLFGAAAGNITIWASRYPFLGAIERAYRPGCKLDEIPILVGEQGIGKSRYLRALLPDEYHWFGDGLEFSGSSKNRVEALQGKVIVEASEMVGSTRAETAAIKSFISRQDDGAVRLSYRRNPEYNPRRCVIIGTTNSRESLPNDKSGNRRFVPVELHKKGDVASLVAIRERLWAEALYQHRRGIEARLPETLHDEASSLAEDHRYKTATEQAILDMDWDAVYYTMEDILDALGDDWSYKRDSKHISSILRHQGWGHSRKLVGMSRKWVWVPPEAES